jgi:hypothetical protein
MPSGGAAFSVLFSSVIVANEYCFLDERVLTVESS